MIYRFDALNRKVQVSGNATGTDLGVRQDTTWTEAEDRIPTKEAVDKLAESLHMQLMEMTLFLFNRNKMTCRDPPTSIF